jgi:hypothetical protein
MPVAIEPALKGQRFGLDARVVGDAILRRQEFARPQIELIAWGTFYPDRAEARAVVKRFRNSIFRSQAD